VVVGACENGLIDPLANFPEIDATVWKHGQISDIGTLGGNASAAQAVNNRGQVTGNASNAIPDPFNQSLGSPTGLWNFGVTQIHAFLWQDEGPMRDLGTLGGPDSVGLYVNERGQVAGVSYTSFIPNQNTGIPTQDPFLWDNDTMIDLGTLGGTAGWPWGLNQRGKVVGQSNLAGDTSSHPFLWDEKNGMVDLGTLGGSNGHATWINDAGEVVGVANLPGDTGHDAFLWKNGVMTDLGNLGHTSYAYAINSGGQIVGASRVNSTTLRAFIWENGGPMVDLNSLILSGSGLTAITAENINDRGEIAGDGQLATFRRKNGSSDRSNY
jgi:probable HAF family extracellular repeat protein